MTGPTGIGIALVFAFLGALAGWAHLHLLSWNVRALSAPSPSVLAAVLSLGRAVVTLAAFVFAVFQGALALLAALAGFLLVRAVLVRRPEFLLP